MFNKRITILILALLSVTSFAKTLAVVGGNKIDSSEVDQQVKLIVKDSKGNIRDTPALRNDILQKLITRKIVTSEAKKLNLDKSKSYLDAVESAKNQAIKSGANKSPSFNSDFEAYKEVILADTYAMNFLKNHQVSDKEAQTAYNSMVKFYQGSEEVKIGEILTKSEANANKAIAELNKGTAFQTVATKYTTDEVLKKSSGIYNNYVNLKDMQAGAPQYYAYVKDMQKNQYSKTALKGPDGYLVIKVIDRRKAQIPAFNTIKNSIKTGLAQSKLQEESERLNKVYQVKIY